MAYNCTYGRELTRVVDACARWQYRRVGNNVRVCGTFISLDAWPQEGASRQQSW